MSMALAVKVWHLDLDKTTSLILLAMCDSADDDGTHCHASEEYLMWKTNVSRATLYRVINALIAKSIISRHTYSDGTIETIITLENAPQKKPWKRPKRGGKRTKQNAASLTTRPFESDDKSHHETLSVSPRDPLSLTTRPFESHHETDTVCTRPEPVSDEGAFFAPIHPNTHPSTQLINPSSLARSANDDTRAVTAPPERRTRERLDLSSLKRDPIILALVACFGREPANPREWDQWRIARNNLSSGGASADDIPRYIRGYQAIYPKSPITPMALAAHQSEIREGKAHDLAQLEIAQRASAADANARRQRQHADDERKAQEQREVQRLLSEYGY